MAALDLFFSYSHLDEALREALETHLSLLKRQGLLRPWNDRRIDAGEDWKREIHAKLESAHLILLLISADFLKSDYCYDIEMKRALERHEAGEATVVPIILRPCDWQSSPFAKLQALPIDGKPLTSWDDRDEAFLAVTKGLRQLIEQIQARSDGEPSFPDEQTREFSVQLESAYEHRAVLVADGEETSDVDSEIAQIKRTMRQGGRLKAGDCLAADRYKLLDLLGKGGFATVWKAYDKVRKTVVAVKVLHAQYGDDRSRRDRFFRGARQMARLRDLPGIVDVLEEECVDDGFYFYVMEYVAGGDFRRAVLETRLSREERLDVILEVGATLQVAHERGIVHRDVKPANILLDLDGRAKLTDFDLVRAADTTGGTRTSKLGTFIYAAPELLTDASKATAAADVYGLSMTALFAIYGRDLPQEAVFEQVAFLESIDVDEAVRAILSRGVARKVAERWSSVADFYLSLSEEVLAKAPGGGLGPDSEIRQAPGDPVDVDGEPSDLNKVETEKNSLLGSVFTLAILVSVTLGITWLLLTQMADFFEELDRVAATQASGLKSPEPGRLWVDPAIGMRFRFIPAGTFLMGSPEGEPGRLPDERQHAVTLTRGYWIGETEVTQSQWREVMGTEPSRFTECGAECPVEQVSWYDAIAFANALSEKAGLSPCYLISESKDSADQLINGSVERLGTCDGYRLPTEAEWECAARAGTESALYTGEISIRGAHHAPELDAIAWYGGNSHADYSDGIDCSGWPEKQYEALTSCGPQPVKGKQPNHWNLYDMLGNVWEWCEDRYSAYDSRPVQDPIGPPMGEYRVDRGGSWIDSARFVRAAARDGWPPSRRNFDLGFRLSRGQSAPAGRPGAGPGTGGERSRGAVEQPTSSDSTPNHSQETP